MGEQIVAETEEVVMDNILNYLIKEIDNNEKSAQAIWENTYPSLAKEEVYFLLKKIIGFNEDLLFHVERDSSISNYTAWFKATPITVSFIKNGGFKSVYANKKREEEEQRKKKDLEIISAQDSLITNSATRRSYRINTAISVTALILSLIALIQGCLK